MLIGQFLQIMFATLVTAFGVSSCLHPPPQPPQPPAVHPVVVWVQTAAGPIQSARVAFGGYQGETAADGHVGFDLPQSASRIHVAIQAEGYQPYGQEVDIPTGLAGVDLCVCATSIPGMIPLPPLVPEASLRPFPPEHGPLTIRDGRFYDEDGQPWLWRGATMFLLLDRMMIGEDIQPQIDWMVSRGVNVARVFIAGVDWPSAHGLLYTREDWPAQMRVLADRLAEAGIRLEATVCTVDCNDTAFWHPIVQGVYSALAGRWNVLVEVANEPHFNGRGTSYLSFDRKGLLTSNGLDPSCGDELYMLDYGTTHLPRDMAHFPRDSKDLFELRERSGKPWVSDEPLGIADYDQQGSGARTTDRSAVASHFGLAMMFGAGATIHSTFGLEGRVPYPSETISQSLAEMITRVWQCVPPEAQLGAYRAPHLSGFPVDCPGASCSELEHAYATVLDDRAWLVVPRPVIGWTPVGVDGWQVDSSCDDLPIWRMIR